MFDLWGHRNPRVLAPVVDRSSRRGKAGFCEHAHWYGNELFVTFDLIVDNVPTVRTEVKDDSAAFITHSDILL